LCGLSMTICVEQSSTDAVISTVNNVKYVLNMISGQEET